MLAGQRVVQQLTTWLGSPNALWRRCTRAPRASVSRRRRRSLVTSCRVGKVTAAYPLQITLAQNRVGARLMEACGCGGRRRAEWRPVLHLRFNKLSLHVPYAQRNQSFSLFLTHIAQGDRTFVAKDYPNQLPPPQSLGTHDGGPYTRIWAPGRRYWAHRSAPRRAIGALSSHDGRRNATMIFHRISTYRVLRWQ